MSWAKPLSSESQRLCRRLWQDGYGARRMALALSRQKLEDGMLESLIKRVLRWREREGLPARWQSVGFPKGQRRTTRPVAPAVTEAKIDAALAREREMLAAELRMARRRCDCGGIIAPGTPHHCQRSA